MILSGLDFQILAAFSSCLGALSCHGRSPGILWERPGEEAPGLHREPDIRGKPFGLPKLA